MIKPKIIIEKAKFLGLQIKTIYLNSMKAHDSIVINRELNIYSITESHIYLAIKERIFFLTQDYLL